MNDVLKLDDIADDELRAKPKILCVNDIEEKTAEWLVDGLIPKGQITSLVACGGAGKTTMLCKIISCLTNGIPFVSEDESSVKEPLSVLYLSAEDTFEHTLRPKLRVMGADMSKIFTVSISDPLFSELTFASKTLEDVIKENRPSLIIFDPIQSFFGEHVRLAERNDVRRCVQTLIGYGTEYGTSTILVVHTNKRMGAFGRDRMADSSDLWDVSRSVLMIGETDEKGIRYMSHEKCNYGQLRQTILFSIHSTGINFEGLSDKRDEDYVYMRGKKKERPAPALEEAKDFICQSVADSPMQIGVLKSIALENGIKDHTFENAKNELISDGVLKRTKVLRGGQSNGCFNWYLGYAIADNPKS